MYPRFKQCFVYRQESLKICIFKINCIHTKVYTQNMTRDYYVQYTTPLPEHLNVIHIKIQEMAICIKVGFRIDLF